MPQSSLKYIVDKILEENQDIKYTKNLNGYFFNTSSIQDQTMINIYDYVTKNEQSK